MIEEKIKNLIRDALQNLNIEVTEISLEHPASLEMGDYSTNIALACAKALKTNPKELAEKIARELLRLNTDKYIEKIEVAGTGFINFFLSRKFFADSVEEMVNQGENVGKNNLLEGKKIMVEYTDPNPFKPTHISLIIRPGHNSTGMFQNSRNRFPDSISHQVADMERLERIRVGILNHYLFSL